MVAASRGGSVSLKALAASIVVHVIVLGTFGVVHFSAMAESQNDVATVAASVSRIKEMSQRSLIAPKPKVTHYDVDDFSKRAERLLSAASVSADTRPSKPALDQSEIIVSTEHSAELADRGSLEPGVEFFGQFSQRRKVCYVVDCSGSMRGMFGRVRRQLKESIGRLWADQYFYVIFFGGGRLYEIADGKLVRATGKAKLMAYDFIESVRPAGLTNAIAALKRAMQILSEHRGDASVIYFLTDGFELTGEPAENFLRQTEVMQKQFAPSSQINTIGFWPQSGDRSLLDTLASQSGGQSVFVGDRDI